jgi:hypothetical protein
MAIGTTVKVGFDGNEVKKGFGAIGGMFRNIGKGMSMGAGLAASQTLEGIIIKAATGINSLADFAGEAEDAALQVGSTTAEIIKLNRALEIAGANVSASNMLSTMKDNIYDASHGGEELQKSFARIGVKMQDLKGLSTMQQFELIGKAVSALGADFDGLENVMSDIFGAKMGRQLIRLFKNTQVFDQVNEETGAFADNIDKSAAKLGEVQDQFARIPQLWRGLNLALFNAMGGSNESNYIKRLFDGIDAAIQSSDFSKLGYLLKAEFAKALEVFSDSGIMQSINKWFEGIGESIGTGIKKSIGLPSFLSSNGMGAGDKVATIDPTKEIMKTNEILTRIARDGGALYS